MDIFKEYQFAIYGCLSGALLGILILSVGFFKMLIIIFLAIMGTVIGYYVKNMYNKK